MAGAWELVAGEAAKAVIASMCGALVDGASKILRSLRRRGETLPVDREELAALIVRLGEQDPAAAAEILEAVAEVKDRTAGPGVLPPALFVNRDTVRGELAKPGMWLVVGAYGVGKTALALQVLQDVTGEYPGGRATVDLDDYRDGEALRVADVMTSILRQLGVQVPELPLPALAEQYFLALVRRRFALVLDNVVDAAEARALVQAWPASLVLVTTRVLTDDLRMWAPTQPVFLHGLDDEGAWELLDARSGRGMLAAEPRAASRLLELCDRMPFAIIQVGMRLSRRRGEAGAVGAVLDEFQREPDTERLIRACLSRTVSELDSSGVDSLVILAHHPRNELSYAEAAALLGRSDRTAVEELVDACLLMRTGRGRLRLHHLVRSYALRFAVGRGVDVEAALDRLLWFVRDHAVAADLALDTPGQGRLRRYPVPERLPTLDAHPLDWLEGEAPLIAALVAQAYHRKRYAEACQLCGALEVLLTSRGHHWLVEGANRWGIRAAQALGDRVVEARLHAMQGRIYTQLHRFAEAAAALDTAARLMSDVDDPRMHSSILEFQARLWEERGALGGAIDRLRQCIAIDERNGLRRGLGLHQRMLANVLVKTGQAAEALGWLGQAEANTSDLRNLARAHMVRAKAYGALGDLAQAHAEVARARELVAQAGATQYDVELADIEAQVARRAGDIETVRARWGWIVREYWNTGHPRFNHYLDLLSQLPPPPG